MADVLDEPDLAMRLAQVALICFDIDGTLTDATTWWGGEATGWVQRYSVRDGEALLRMARAGIPVVPLSRNKTQAARRRVVHLGCATDWLGVTDKIAAVEEIAARFEVERAAILHIGDGPDDAPVFEHVGLGVAVADAHPRALAAAALTLRAGGGQRAIEELETHLRAAGHAKLGGGA